MNRCHEDAADILLYLNDALTGHRLDELREHLASCPDCSAQLEDELALSSLGRFRSAAAVEDSDSTIRSLRSRLRSGFGWRQGCARSITRSRQSTRRGIIH
jgi:hypothetical protein